MWHVSNNNVIDEKPGNYAIVCRDDNRPGITFCFTKLASEDVWYLSSYKSLANTTVTTPLPSSMYRSLYASKNMEEVLTAINTDLKDDDNRITNAPNDAAQLTETTRKDLISFRSLITTFLKVAAAWTGVGLLVGFLIPPVAIAAFIIGPVFGALHGASEVYKYCWDDLPKKLRTGIQKHNVMVQHYWDTLPEAGQVQPIVPTEQRESKVGLGYTARIEEKLGGINNSSLYEPLLTKQDRDSIGSEVTEQEMDSHDRDSMGSEVKEEKTKALSPLAEQETAPPVPSPLDEQETAPPVPAPRARN